MLKQMWKEMPMGFKVTWSIGVFLGAGLTGLICTLLFEIIKYMMRH